MDPKHLYLDERLKGRCAYCAGYPDTKDHVPPRIFLDNPLPIGGYTVEACTACNQRLSSDEEYVACFIECVISGSVDSIDLGRPKIRKALDHSPALQERIRNSFRDHLWHPEIDRINEVLAKLAQGHVAYEFSESGLEIPTSIVATPFELLSFQDRIDFELAGTDRQTLWPEIGSRGFLRAAGAHPFQDEPGPWIVVQNGRYRYSVGLEPHLIVRIAISEYLACIIEW